MNAPFLARVLRFYQQRAATFLYEHDAAFLIAPLGAGKGAAALTALSATGTTSNRRSGNSRSRNACSLRPMDTDICRPAGSQSASAKRTIGRPSSLASVAIRCSKVSLISPVEGTDPPAGHGRSGGQRPQG